MRKINTPLIKKIIKIMCVVLIVGIMLGLYPLNIIPSASMSYRPDGTFEWENVKTVQIKTGDILQQEYQTTRVTEFEAIELIINDKDENADGTLNVSLYDLNSNMVGNTAIKLSDIECGKKLRLPLKTRKLDKNDNYYLLFEVQGEGSVELYLVDEKAENYFGMTCVNGESCDESVLVEVYTTEYAATDIGAYVWLFGMFIIVIIVIPWKKIGYVYLRIFTILDASVLFLLMSYYQKMYQTARNFSELKKLYLGFAIIAVLILLLHAYVIVRKVYKKEENCFLISAFGWGIIYLLLMPPYSYPDEPTHYAQANAYINQLMGCEVRDEIGQIYIRTEELIDVTSFPSAKSLVDYYDQCLTRRSESGYGTMGIVNGYGLSRASAICYLPFEIGILISRVCKLNYMWSFTLTNMLGLVFYVLIMYIAMRFMPTGKWILFLSAQFPLALSMATSITYDLINYSLLTLFFAIFCKSMHDQSLITWRNMLLWVIVGVIVFPIKYAYFPFAFMIIFIPDEKFSFSHVRVFKVTALVLLLILVFSDNQVTTFVVKKEVAQQGGISEAGISDVRQLYEVKEGSWRGREELIGDKGNFIKYAYNTFYKHLDYYWNGMIGMKIGWGDSFIPDYVYNTWWLLMLFAIINTGEERLIFGRRVRIGIFLICALCFGAIYMAMFLGATPVGYTDCPSVGARYILPLLFPISVALRGNKVIIAEGISDEFFVWGADLCQIIAFVYMFAGYLSR